MVVQEVTATVGEHVQEQRMNVVGKITDGIFNVVALPVERGMNVDVPLLVQKAVGGFHAVPRDGCGNRRLNGVIIVTDGAELFLLKAVDEPLQQQIAPQLGWFATESIAERFQRVELLVAQQHIHARDQDGRVGGQIIHSFSETSMQRYTISPTHGKKKGII